MQGLIAFMTLVGAIGAASGVGIMLLALPTAWRRSPLSLLLTPAMGLGQTSVIGIYVIAARGRPEVAIYWSLATSLLLAIVASSTRRRALLDDLDAMRANLRADAAGIMAILLASVVVFAFLLLPPLGHPWRLGIDQIGNAITIEYLRRGGDLDTLHSAVLEQTGHTDLERAYADNMSAVQVNIGVASEFLLKSMRWGYPMLLAGLMRATGFGPAVLFQLPVLFFAGLAAGALASLFFSVQLGWKPSDAITSGLVAAFSCNLVNLLGEGQHSQYFTSPFLMLAVVAWFGIRRAYQEGQPVGYAWPAMLTIAVATIVAAYSEMFSVLCAVMGLASLLDMVMARRIFQRHHFTAAACVIAGFLLTGPYAYIYPVYILKQFRTVTSGNSGFNQPHWAQLSDILGLTNLYAVSGFGKPWIYSVFNRRFLETPCVYAASLCAMVLMLRPKAWASPWRRGPWLAASGVVLLAYRISFKNSHNYLYYKTYVMTNFLFYSWFVTALHSAVAGPKVSPAIRKHGVVFINTLMLLVSLGYLQTYRAEARWTGGGTMALFDWDREHDANRHVFLSTDDDISGYFSVYMEAGAIPLNWLNINPGSGRRRTHLAPHIGKRILVLSIARGDYRPPRFGVQANRPFLIQTPQLTLYDTGVDLSRELADRLEAELAEASKSGPASTRLVWQRFFIELGLGIVD